MTKKMGSQRNGRKSKGYANNWMMSEPVKLGGRCATVHHHSRKRESGKESRIGDKAVNAEDQTTFCVIKNLCVSICRIDTEKERER